MEKVSAFGFILNPLQTSVAFLYPLKISENLKVFFMFSGGIEKQHWVVELNSVYKLKTVVAVSPGNNHVRCNWVQWLVSTWSNFGVCILYFSTLGPKLENILSCNICRVVSIKLKLCVHERFVYAPSTQHLLFTNDHSFP